MKHTALIIALLLTAAGCGVSWSKWSTESATSTQPTDAEASRGPNAGAYASYSNGEIKFLDSAPANTAPVPGISALTFTKPDGTPTKLQEFLGKKYVVLVVTRGNTAYVCPYCSTQTARLISAYDEFAQRGAEVVLVYPVEAASDSTRLEAFLSNVRGQLGDPNRPVPFPVVLDVQLQAVDQLGIRRDLSKPATYIIDPTGEVRYAYVGSHLADRPSVKAVLQQLDQLESGKGGGA
ncbi:MAG: redoxin domain-containing protein [Planctomycetaceae bacterium]